MTDRRERPPSVFFGASDWLGGTATLPPMVEWVYLQISLYCMDKGEPVPGNRLGMILVRHGGDWQSDLDLLVEIGKVAKTSGGGYFVKRALIEYERAESAISKKRKAGKAGAEKRWNSNDEDSTANGTANGDATENRCDTNATRQDKTRAEQSDPNGSQGGALAQGDLIDAIDPDIWKAFAEHRIKLKAPLTDRAATMLRNKLHEIATDHGHDPNRILEQSIMRGWKGVFPLKDDDTGNGKRSGWDFVR